jgi:hypothetical protein
MTKQDLQELITPEFLSTLHTAVECWGWSGDMVEAMDFCRWCYDMVELPAPEFDVDVDFEMKGR